MGEPFAGVVGVPSAKPSPELGVGLTAKPSSELGVGLTAKPSPERHLNRTLLAAS